MTTPPTTLARPGDIVRIAAQDYVDGTAAVTVRITSLAANLDRIRGLEWIRILAADLEKPGEQSRALLVRATALQQPPPPPGMPAQLTPAAPHGHAPGRAPAALRASPRRG